MSLAADVLVAVDNVEKHWDETSGLQALTMEVRARELVVVRGRSGTGKSTLLAMIAGWCPPDSGVVTWGPAFEGCDITAWDQVAVVPQVLALMGELSARENIEVALRGCGVSRTAASERADEVLDAFSSTSSRSALPARRHSDNANARRSPVRSRSSRSSCSPTSRRAIRMRRALAASWTCSACEPRSAEGCWSRPTTRWSPPRPTVSSTSTRCSAELAQSPASRHAYARAWRRESVKAVPFHAMSNAVPWSTEVRMIGRPSVTFTPASKASSFMGA